MKVFNAIALFAAASTLDHLGIALRATQRSFNQRHQTIMPFVPKSTEPTKTIAFRLPPELTKLYEQVRELCEQQQGRLDLNPVVLPAIEAELKAVRKKLST